MSTVTISLTGTEIGKLAKIAEDENKERKKHGKKEDVRDATIAAIFVRIGLREYENKKG